MADPRPLSAGTQAPPLAPVPAPYPPAPRRLRGGWWLVLALWLIAGAGVGMIFEHKFQPLGSALGAPQPTPPPVRPPSTPASRAPHETIQTALTRAIAQTLPSVVAIAGIDQRGRRLSHGAGVLYRYDSAAGVAWAITNNHVIKDSPTVKVALGDATYTIVRERQATTGGETRTDPETDLAIVRFDVEPGLPLKSARFGDSDRVVAGQFVAAIGHPFDLQNTATFGIISATERSGFTRPTWFGKLAIGGFANFLQTSAPINIGASGGPLINLAGEVVGINVWTLDALARERQRIGDENTGTAGNLKLDIDIGFAVPANLVCQVADDLIALGYVRRAALGLQIDRRQTTRFGRPGVLIGRVLPDSPAQDAGLQRGDLIVALNGRAIKNQQHFATLIAHYAPGQHIMLSVWRTEDGGEPRRLELPVTLGVRHEPGTDDTR